MAKGVDTSTDVLLVIMVVVTVVTESTVDEAMLLTGVDVKISTEDSTDEGNIMDVTTVVIFETGNKLEDKISVEIAGVKLVVNGVSDGDDTEISVEVMVSKIVVVDGSTDVLLMVVIVVANGTTVDEATLLTGVDVKGSTVDSTDEMSVDKTDVESVAEMNRELEEVKIIEDIGVTIVPSIVVVIGTGDANGLEIVLTVTDGVTEVEMIVVVVVIISEDNGVEMDVRVVVAKLSTGVVLSEITDGKVGMIEVDVNTVVSGIETILVVVEIKVSAEVTVDVIEISRESTGETEGVTGIEL